MAVASLTRCAVAGILKGVQGDQTMSASNILIGGESFRRIREDNCYYIDKTMFLEELLSQTPPMVSLITRPRRFGKTLNMTMLQEFFDIRQDSRKLFDDLQ